MKAETKLYLSKYSRNDFEVQSELVDVVVIVFHPE